MNHALTLLAGLALGPAMLGPLDDTSHRLALPLCGGGTLAIDIPGQDAPLPGTGPCCAKGCRTGKTRKRTPGAA